jgi:hypothetical protein
MRRALILPVLLIAALVLAACGGDVVPSGYYWWCEWDFQSENSFNPSWGSWVNGSGYVTNSEGLLSLTYYSSTSVTIDSFQADAIKYAAGAMSLTAAGQVFNVDVNVPTFNEIPSELIPLGEVFTFGLSNEQPGYQLSNTISITLRSNAQLAIAGLRVYGTGVKPATDLAGANCFEVERPTEVPTETYEYPTNTPIPATGSPTPTGQSTAMPTPTITPTLTPSWSPTPSPTPTAFFYLSPLIRSSDSIVCPYDCYQQVTAVVQPNAAIMGILLEGRNNAASDNTESSLAINSHSGSVGTPVFPVAINGNGINRFLGPGSVATQAAAVIPTGYAIQTFPQFFPVAPPGSTVRWAWRFWANWTNNAYTGMYHDYRFVLQGWPTATPTGTPSPTPTSGATATPTPTLTPTPLGSATAGPTFTPSPRATNLPVPGGTPPGGGGRFNANVNICAFGDGLYLWDASRASFYSQGWQVPANMRAIEDPSPWNGSGHTLDMRANGDREMNLQNLRPRWASNGTITEFIAYATAPQNEWAIAGGNTALENPQYGTHLTGSGWAVVPVNTNIRQPLFISVRLFNPASQYHNIVVTHIGLRVVGCEPPPPTPTPFNPYVPPPTLNQAQQTQAARMTATAQASITPFGTYTGNATAWAQTATAWANDGRATLDAISTMVYQGTPVGTLVTPVRTPGPTPTASGGNGGGGSGGGGIGPGLGGDISDLANNVFGVIGNVGNTAGSWLGNLTLSFDRVINAWYAAPPQAPPGVPLCSTQPRSNQFCAILYIIRYTLLSGPVGSLIMPLATVVFDLFIVFMFIRFVRAILARLGRVVV